MVKSPTPDSALVGRQDELDLVIELLSRGGSAVVLAGEAGVGKTRLSVEAIHSLVESGFDVARTIATLSSASFPLGPLSPLVDVQGENRHELFVRTVRAFADRGRAGQFLLVVDDAHLLDPLSATVVQALVLEGTCSVLVTIRTGEPTPDPITALWKDGLADRIEMQNLSRAESGALAESLLGGAVDASTHMTLWKTSSGNPLYVREVIFGSLEAGSLARDDGFWRLTGEPRTSLRLRDVVATTIESLTDDARIAMEFLSLADPIDMAFLTEAAGPSAIASLEHRGLIAVDRDQRRAVVRPAHPMFAEAVRARIPGTRGWAIRERLAAMVIATGARRRNDPLDIALWQLDAGVTPDLQMLRKGAVRASEAFDLELNHRLRRAAYEASNDIFDGYRLGETIAELGRFEDADRLFAELIARAEDPDEVAPITHARAYNLGIRLGRDGEAHELLDRSIGSAEGDRRDWAVALKCLLQEFAGRPDLALQILEPMLVDGQDGLVRFAGVTQARCLVLVGRLDDAIRWAGISEAAFGRMPGNQPLETQRFARVMALTELGSLVDARALAEQGREAMLEIGAQEGQATFLFALARIELARGRVETAAKLFREGVAINRAIMDPPALWWALGGLALSHALAGRPSEAHASLAEADEVDIGSVRMFRADLALRARAWTAVADGEVSRGRDVLVEAASFAAASSQFIAESTLLHDVARLGEPGRVMPRLAELATLIDGELASTRAAHAVALDRHDAAGLLAVSERFVAMEASLLGAEAAFDAARAFEKNGTARRAAAAAAVGTRLLGSCEGATTPAARWGEPVEPLTAREREIAGLAARGLTSKVIGERLFLSPRTVDNHLAQVYTKLGVSKRSDLRAALSDGDD